MVGHGCKVLLVAPMTIKDRFAGTPYEELSYKPQASVGNGWACSIAQPIPRHRGKGRRDGVMSVWGSELSGFRIYQGARGGLLGWTMSWYEGRNLKRGVNGMGGVMRRVLSQSRSVVSWWYSGHTVTCERLCLVGTVVQLWPE